MNFKIIALLVLLLPHRGWSTPQTCRQALQDFPPETVLTEFQIEYNDSDAIAILRKIHRIYLEYPIEYMQISRTTAWVTVPESRWLEIFAQDYESVIHELSRVKIRRVETYEDGSRSRFWDADLLVSFRNDETRHYPHEWVPIQKAYSFQLDRRILTLMERHRESANVMMVLELGIIDGDFSH
jgi:hypothetical protein